MSRAAQVGVPPNGHDQGDQGPLRYVALAFQYLVVLSLPVCIPALFVRFVVKCHVRRTCNQQVLSLAIVKH